MNNYSGKYMNGSFNLMYFKNNMFC